MNDSRVSDSPVSDSRPERFVDVDAGERRDAAAFLARALRQDAAAVVRVDRRSDGRIGLWVNTGFEVLATRSVVGECRPDDLVCDAAALRSALAESHGPIDPGFGYDSAWRGALPAAGQLRHVDDVPARRVVELARAGAGLAAGEGSGHGPATSLLDQPVLRVQSADHPSDEVSVALRSLFALTSMGFVRDRDHREVTDSSPVSAIAETEPVRVRASPTWVRLDARFGSVYQRRSEALGLTVL